MKPIKAFFGDGEKLFAFPTLELIQELEAKTGFGIGELVARLRQHAYSVEETNQIIRLGLIGGGTTPAEAARLVGTYATARPLVESYMLAMQIITELYAGPEEEEPAPDDDFDFPQDETPSELADDMRAAYENEPA